MKRPPKPILAFLLLIAPSLMMGADPDASLSGTDVLFRQPSLEGFGDRMHVQARVPVGEFAMISWQKNPMTGDGSFVPVDWNVGEKTGLPITENRSAAQRGMKNQSGSTAAQMSGIAVGAYLNSADLSGAGMDAQGCPLPGSGGYKLMVTPQIFFPPAEGEDLLRAPGDKLAVSMDLQIPVAVSAGKKGSIAYVNPVLVFIDPKRKIKISYIVGLFSSWPVKTKPKMVENIAYDTPSHSWMISSRLMPGARWMTIGADSNTYQFLPWMGWKHFSYSITRQNFESALANFRAKQPEIDCSMNPADYRLKSFHLNAELKYQTAPAELGWSMRNASITVGH
ncbi:MAG: hypothetical protein K9M45_01275 [Kiritimatiellales bacterium]|nr:hypothetical protein [Kiritimatiellales bacterium]